MIVSDNVGDDGLFIRMVNADICIRQKTHVSYTSISVPKSQTTGQLSGKTQGHGFLILFRNTKKGSVLSEV